MDDGPSVKENIYLNLFSFPFIGGDKIDIFSLPNKRE